MKLNLFLLVFLTGVFSVTMKAVRHDYYLITTPATWDDALTYCFNDHKILATVQSDDDWERLNAEAASKGLPTTGWVGLYNEINSWYWEGGGPLWNYTLTNWSPGQPDNNGGNEMCAAINTNGSWEDCPCTDLKPFICYSATLKGFIAVRTPTMSWMDSDNYCWRYHTSLASATNVTINNELQQLALEQGTSWFGLYRYGWYWVIEPKVEEPRWGPGFPNNVDHDANCASVNNSLLVDRQCDSLFNFFCHTPYTRRYQVVKLKIKGDKSVFDSAVQSAILQNILQKMKEHGIWREISVTWRVQPDGNIFQKESKDAL